ncbi:tRNA pseudouridine(38-40) synthase TruA, partial [bacterium]|nr:tRNA pseudouridine(38-40) synthase TruA [bacterium]
NTSFVAFYSLFIYYQLLFFALLVRFYFVYIITLSYCGKRYHGWQIQKNANTIQAELHKALFRIFKKNTQHPAGCSRTDTAVHALHYVATVSKIRDIPPENLKRGLNSLLPVDIRVRNIEVQDGFVDARKLVFGKHYRYLIFSGQTISPFMHDLMWHSAYPLDAALMQQAANHFVGKHDFATFQASGTDITYTVRSIYHASVTQAGDYIMVDWVGDGFLKHQVRTMTGLIVAAGRGKVSPDDIPAIIGAKNRDAAAETLPGKGLYLHTLFRNEGESEKYIPPTSFQEMLF